MYKKKYNLTSNNSSFTNQRSLSLKNQEKKLLTQNKIHPFINKYKEDPELRPLINLTKQFNKLYMKDTNIRKNRLLDANDGDELSKAYASQFNSNSNIFNTKYNFSPGLSYDEKTEIKKCINSSVYPKNNNKITKIKNSNISYYIHPVKSNCDKYNDPFNSKRLMNLNKEIFTTIQNIRMKTQCNTFFNKIGDNLVIKNRISKMPKIKVTKITPISTNLFMNQMNPGSLGQNPVPTNPVTEPNINLNSNQNNTNNMNNNVIIPNYTNIVSTESNKNDEYTDSSRHHKNSISINEQRKIFGGLSRDQALNEVSLQLTEIVTQYHPPAREQFSFCITDEEIIYIFGGIQGKMLNDLWKFHLMSKNSKRLVWQKFNIRDEEAPIPRYGHTMTYFDEHIYIYGGLTPQNYWKSKEDNIIIYDTKYNQYTYPTCQNFKNVPNRKNHIGISIGATMLIHGGIDDEGNYLNDIWIFEYLKLKWSPLFYRTRMPKIPKIAYHSCALVVKNQSIMLHEQFSIYKMPEMAINKIKGNKPKVEGVYVFGGIERDNSYSKGLWVLRIGTKPVDIIKLRTFGKGPIPRTDCAMTYLRALNLLVIHGGKNVMNKENTVLRDVWIFDLDSLHWIKPIYNDYDMLPVCGHIDFCFGNNIYIFGGYNKEGFGKFDFYNMKFNFANNKYK